MPRGVGAAILGKMGTLKKLKDDPRPLVIDTTHTQLVSHDLNHSPLESPPLLKKKLRRLGTAGSQSLPPQLVRGESNKTTLCRKDAPDSPSILKKDPYQCQNFVVKDRPVQKKKVKFDNEVTVHIMTDGGHMCTQCQELNNDSKCRKDYIKRHNIKKNRSQLFSPSLNDTAQTDLSNTCATKHSIDNSDRGTMPRETYLGQLGGRVDTNANLNPMLQTQVQITFEQSSQQETKLKFLIFLGREYQPENIVVKANVTGSRIRVLATHMATMADGHEVVQEFNERYALPMNVDPFKVEAKLDCKGYLAVVAPLVTLQRQEGVKVSQATSLEE